MKSPPPQLGGASTQVTCDVSQSARLPSMQALKFTHPPETEYSQGLRLPGE
jgi:hypothetical protein